MRGDGRVYQRKGSPFYWCEYWLRGRQHRESTGTADEKKAQKFLRHRLMEVGADKIGAKAFVSPKQERTTINELLDSLESDYKLRGKWNGTAESNMKPLREHFGDWRATELDPDDVSAYIEGMLDEEYAPATCNRRTQLLGQAYKLAVRTKKLNSVPFIPHLSEVGNERQGFFEVEDFDRMVAELPEHLKDVARCAHLIGWRKNALRTLRWSDVGEGVIYLRSLNSKTRKPKTVPISVELAEILERRRAARQYQDKNGVTHLAEYVFHDEGKRLGEFRQAWIAACCAADIGKLVCPSCNADLDRAYQCSGCGKDWKWRKNGKYVGRLFHDFRRTAARNMVRSGVPESVAMQITGHETNSMFRRYAITDEEQKRDALAKTEEYLAERSKEKGKVLVMGAGKS